MTSSSSFVAEKKDGYLPLSPPRSPLGGPLSASEPCDIWKLGGADDVRTLASLSNETNKQVDRSDAVSVATSAALATRAGRRGVAILVASSPSHELDRAQQPQPLLELGGVSMVSHALWQLNSAHFAAVIVVVGYQGEEVQKQLLQYIEIEKENFNGLRLKFVNLGKGWRGGRVASLISCRSLVDELVKPWESFVVIGADHIFDSALLEPAAIMDLSRDGDEACVLVESDLEGMCGLPPSTVFCATRPLHGADRIYSIGADLETYSGIEAGLMVFTPATLRELANFSEDMGRRDVRVAHFLSEIAKRGTLRMLKTNGCAWFSVETTESADFTSNGLRSRGQEYTLADGRKVHLVGLPRKIETSPSDGGEWSEFSVDQWRSAVYTAKSFFLELFEDSTNFIGKLCDELGGSSDVGPLLVEVGCGTGEALLPLFDRARFTCGMDFNPHFVKFCQENVPALAQKNVRHLVGDACELNHLLDHELPECWMNRAKVVICVGNTIGIMPPAVKKQVYQEMKQLAGIDGYMVVVYWNGNKFGDAVQNFYHKNPQLCGKFTGECIDLDTCTLTTPSGYCTHWTKPEEARAIFEQEVGAEVIALQEKGNGVLVAGRMRKVSAAA
jgi:NDP-sugar pyrophosphorylase family protein